MASSRASLDVEIVTVNAIVPNLPDRREVIEYDDKTVPRGYDIIVKGKNLNLGPIEITPNRKDFVDKLKEGDKLLIVRQGELYLSVYGPIEEGKLYNCRRYI